MEGSGNVKEKMDDLYMFVWYVILIILLIRIKFQQFVILILELLLVMQLKSLERLNGIRFLAILRPGVVIKINTFQKRVLLHIILHQVRRNVDISVLPDLAGMSLPKLVKIMLVSEVLKMQS